MANTIDPKNLGPVSGQPQIKSISGQAPAVSKALPKIEEKGLPTDTVTISSPNEQKLLELLEKQHGKLSELSPEVKKIIDDEIKMFKELDADAQGKYLADLEFKQALSATPQITIPPIPMGGIGSGIPMSGIGSGIPGISSLPTSQPAATQTNEVQNKVREDDTYNEASKKIDEQIQGLEEQKGKCEEEIEKIKNEEDERVVAAKTNKKEKIEEVYGKNDDDDKEGTGRIGKLNKQIAEKNKNIDEKKKNIDDKDKNIKDKDKNIANKNENITKIEGELPIAESNLNNLRAQRDASDNPSIYNSQISTAEQKVEQLKVNLKQLNEDKKQLEQEKKDMETKRGELKEEKKKLEEEKKTLEANKQKEIDQRDSLLKQLENGGIDIEKFKKELITPLEEKKESYNEEIKALEEGPKKEAEEAKRAGAGEKKVGGSFLDKLGNIASALTPLADLAQPFLYANAMKQAYSGGLGGISLGSPLTLGGGIDQMALTKALMAQNAAVGVQMAGAITGAIGQNLSNETASMFSRNPLTGGTSGIGQPLAMNRTQASGVTPKASGGNQSAAGKYDNLL